MLNDMSIIHESIFGILNLRRSKSSEKIASAFILNNFRIVLAVSHIFNLEVQS